MTEPVCATCGLTFAQHDDNDCMGDWPPSIKSIARGYFAARFGEVETVTCDFCQAKPGEQCWEWSEVYPSLVRIERVVPHRERFEAWQSTTPTE